MAPFWRVSSVKGISDSSFFYSFGVHGSSFGAIIDHHYPSCWLQPIVSVLFISHQHFFSTFPTDFFSPSASFPFSLFSFFLSFFRNLSVQSLSISQGSSGTEPPLFAFIMAGIASGGTNLHWEKKRNIVIVFPELKNCKAAFISEQKRIRTIFGSAIFFSKIWNSLIVF